MSNSVHIAFDGLDEFSEHIKFAGKQMQGADLAEIGELALTHPMREAQSRVPRLTSTLYRSIRIERLEVKQHSALLALVAGGDHVPYAAIQEFGGVIRPKRAKMLHWIDDAGNHVFANLVRIPAQPYMRPGWKAGLPALKSEIQTQYQNRMNR